MWHLTQNLFLFLNIQRPFGRTTFKITTTFLNNVLYSIWDMI
jgi:hypothetical protein